VKWDSYFKPIKGSEFFIFLKSGKKAKSGIESNVGSFWFARLKADWYGGHGVSILDFRDGLLGQNYHLIHRWWGNVWWWKAGKTIDPKTVTLKYGPRGHHSKEVHERWIRMEMAGFPLQRVKKDFSSRGVGETLLLGQPKFFKTLSKKFFFPGVGFF